MRFAVSPQRSAGFVAAVLLGSLLAACSGGATPAVPAQAVQSVQQAPSPVSVVDSSLSVDAASAPSVMSLVSDARAHAMPVQGSLTRPELADGPTGALSTAKDLHNYGGPTVKSIKWYDILVNCAASCWGTPDTFQTNLSKSAMIHLIDQYIGLTTSARYTFGGYIPTTYTIKGTLHDSDVFNIVHAAALKDGTGNGYGVEYHVFFAKGVNQCSSAAGGCYSPSNPANWTYCAYHGFTTFSDVGHVLYSVEPYQAVNGCEVTGTAPNGGIVDSTSSTLSHESYETITDPDVPSKLAWYNNNYGEIGDICAPGAGISTGTVSLNSHTYNIQKEYSNYSHICKFSK